VQLKKELDNSAAQRPAESRPNAPSADNVNTAHHHSNDRNRPWEGSALDKIEERVRVHLNLAGENESHDSPRKLVRSTSASSWSTHESGSGYVAESDDDEFFSIKPAATWPSVQKPVERHVLLRANPVHGSDSSSHGASDYNSINSGTGHSIGASASSSHTSQSERPTIKRATPVHGSDSSSIGASDYNSISSGTAHSTGASTSSSYANHDKHPALQLATRIRGSDSSSAGASDKTAASGPFAREIGDFPAIERANPVLDSDSSSRYTSDSHSKQSRTVYPKGVSIRSSHASYDKQPAIQRATPIRGSDSSSIDRTIHSASSSSSSSHASHGKQPAIQRANPVRDSDSSIEASDGGWNKVKDHNPWDLGFANTFSMRSRASTSDSSNFYPSGSSSQGHHRNYPSVIKESRNPPPTISTGDSSRK
jgi:hypothetical protein